MSFDLQPTLTGALLEVRPLRALDYDALFAVASDPLIWEQHPDSRHEPEVFRAFFEAGLESGGALIVHDARTRQVIGSSRYHGYDEASSEVEIGWTFLARSHWGGRYNAELKQLMLDHAFQFVQSVVFKVHPLNVRSQTAVLRIGAVRMPERDTPTSFFYRIRRESREGRP